MPPQLPRIMLSIDPTTEDALDYLTERYGLTRSALVRLAVRRMAEAEGWERQGKALVARAG